MEIIITSHMKNRYTKDAGKVPMKLPLLNTDKIGYDNSTKNKTK